MSFYSQVGEVAIGSRLRQLSETLTEGAADIYELYDVPADPRWFPVLYVLANQESATITEIAQHIGHSHPSVSQIVKKMNAKGLAEIKKSSQDARISVVTLSEEGKRILPNFEQQCADVAQATQMLLAEARHNLWSAIEETEFLLTDRSLLERVRSVRKNRESSAVKIVEYRPEHQADFARLNYEWIDRYFEREEADRQSLDQPEEKILDSGGCILMAQVNNSMVGTCALLKVSNDVYELAKMAVTDSAKGKGIGFLLGTAILSKAKELGARTVFLESNTVLEPAIGLYQKLGFRKVIREPSPYKRCNIQMEIDIL